MSNFINVIRKSRMKIIIPLCIVLSSILIFSNLSVADNIEVRGENVLPGRMMSDGSYQFSEKELDRLNIFKTNNRHRMNKVTFEEFLKYCAPEYFDSLEPSVQDYLSKSLWEKASSNIVPNGSTDGPHAGTKVDISKYGNSLRARMIIDMAPMSKIPDDFAYLVAQASIVEKSTGREIAYAHNVEHWADGQRGRCTATAIADPPSGIYTGWGTYTIPKYHNISGWYLVRFSIYTPDFSYINPY